MMMMMSVPPTAAGVNDAGGGAGASGVEVDHEHERRRKEEEESVEVYVTGFGPFGEHRLNPSSQITNTFLPKHTLPHRLHTPTTTYKTTLHPHPTPIRVSYPTVATVVPKIWSTALNNQSGSPYILHVGVGSAGRYTLETIAHSGGYVRLDVDGEVPKRQVEGVVYECLFDVGWICGFVNDALTTEDQGEEGSGAAGLKVELSKDAGRYLCEYIYATSCKEAVEKYGSTRGVLFLHVPPEGTIERGRRVVEKVVEGMLRDSVEGGRK